VDATTKAGLLDLLEEALDAGWLLRPGLPRPGAAQASPMISTAISAAVKWVVS
jgi:hypothetical protein